MTELTVIVPTFNERGNVDVLVSRLRAALTGFSWRVIFVDDDSPDGTADAVKAWATEDARIQCLHRVGRRGLAGAVIEGILASSTPFVAVIDGDLQHDETLLPGMAEALRSGAADLVVGTRFASDDGLASGLSGTRKLGSRVATWAARRVLRVDVSDPVSGFFMVKRELVDRVAPKLSHQGFKILFDIIASQPEPLRIVELPYAFAERSSGESKLDSRVVADYAGLLLSKWTGSVIPSRAFIFLIVSCIGIAAQLVVLAAVLALGQRFVIAQSIAALAVLAGAVAIDALLIDARNLAVPRRLAWGLLGVVANVAVADLAYRHRVEWLLAGAVGAAIGAMWTYASRER